MTTTAAATAAAAAAASATAAAAAALRFLPKYDKPNLAGAFDEVVAKI